MYGLLVTLQAEVLSKMREGAIIKDVYQAAVSHVKSKKPELEKNFVKSIGFGVSYLNLLPMSVTL